MAWLVQLSKYAYNLLLSGRINLIVHEKALLSFLYIPLSTCYMKKRSQVQSIINAIMKKHCNLPDIFKVQFIITLQGYSFLTVSLF